MAVNDSFSFLPASESDRGVWIDYGKVFVELAKHGKSIISRGLAFANAFTENAWTKILEIGVIPKLVGVLKMTDDDEIDDEESDEGTGAISIDPRHIPHEQLVTGANILAELAKHGELNIFLELCYATVLQMASIDRTRNAILEEPAVQALVSILKRPWPRVGGAAVDALVELAKHGRPEN
jgi:hypothetical protein